MFIVMGRLGRFGKEFPVVRGGVDGAIRCWQFKASAEAVARSLEEKFGQDGYNYTVHQLWIEG